MEPTGPLEAERRRRRIAEVLERAREVTGSPALACAVRVGGRAVYEAGHGLADVETLRPCRAGTRFRVASISKALTAAGMALLQAEGRLDVDAPLSSLLGADGGGAVPDAAAARAVTPRLLAAHLAGVRHYRDAAEFRHAGRHATVRDALPLFGGDPLAHAPGSAYLYSTYSYTALAAALEAAAGEPFEAFMRRRVLRPFGMHDTAPEDAREVRVGGSGAPARYYARGGERGLLRHAPYVDLSCKVAGGGYVSSAPDVALFGDRIVQIVGAAALRACPKAVPPPAARGDAEVSGGGGGGGGELLRLPTAEALLGLFVPYEVGGKSTQYGLGWAVRPVGRLDGPGQPPGGPCGVSHGGAGVGASSYLLVVPSLGLSVAVLSNLEGARLRLVAEEVAAAAVM